MKAARGGPLFSLPMKHIVFPVFLAFGLVAGVSAQMDQEATTRSSHPRGIASDGRPAQPTSSRAATPPVNTTVRQGASYGTSSVNAVSAPAQGGREGVNISGSTRIDARSNDATAAAIGQKNTAGNRVGSIGGKQD